MTRTKARWVIWRYHRSEHRRTPVALRNSDCPLCRRDIDRSAQRQRKREEGWARERADRHRAEAEASRRWQERHDRRIRNYNEALRTWGQVK